MSSSSETRPRVALIRCPDYEPGRLDAAIRDAVDAVGGPGAFVAPGGRVLLKPNVMMPKPPGHACCTHPLFVKSVIEIFQRHGCKVAVGESSAGSQAGLTFTGQALQSSGMEDAARQAGAEVLNLDFGGVKKVETANPFAPVIPVAKAVFESDLVVTLPKLKTHAFANLITGAVKNCYGLVPGQIKADFHRRAPRPDEFFSIIRDLFRAVGPKLAVFDAVTGMEGNGPSAGAERRIGFIIASPDPVAADAVASALIGIPPRRVLTTRLCHEAGLGIGDLSGIEIVGENLERSVIRDFKHPTTVVVNPYLYKLILTLTPTRPEFDHEVCRKCGICADSCPVQAISEKDGRMTIDRKACLGCLCCCEVCPRHAVRPKRKTPLGGILAKLMQSRW